MTRVFHSPHPELDVPEVSLPDLLLSRADQHGSKPALIDGISGRSLTFTEMAASVRALAHGLHAIGFRKGDVAALIIPNCPEFGLFFLAVARLGGISTTLNPTSTAEEIKAQVSDSGARYLFAGPEQAARAVPAREWRGFITRGKAPGAVSIEELMASWKPGMPAPSASIDPRNDVVLLPYSSGTTGMSKGVQLTHWNLVANLHQIQHPIFTEDDVVIGLAPFFHIYGLTVVLNLGLFLGATDVVLPRFEPQTFVEVVEKYGVTHANLVPPLILALARHPSLDPRRLRSLRTIQSGAAPLPPEIAAAFAERFDCRVLQGYGLTETSPVTHIAPRTRRDIPVDSVGPPVAGTECQIRDLSTGRLLGPGSRGELYVRGPQVMRGYLNAPAKTRAMLDDQGWLRTGDVATSDRAGNFYIVDRVKELIKYKAYPIAPAELEALLLAHPDVVDAAVIPSPDPAVGEVPKAYVVRAGEIGAGALMSWIAERVAPHKKIRQIVFVDEIPKSPSGKILRRLLIDRDRARTPSPHTSTPGSWRQMPDPRFLHWFNELERRYLTDLTFSEVRRGVQALSSTWVENRSSRLASALTGRGKRAAFAMFYSPLHYLLIQGIVRRSGAATDPIRSILDLGCGTGAAGAAWALSIQGSVPEVTGVERHAWALEEARWSWRTLGLRGRLRQADLNRVRLPAEGRGIVVAFTANELDDGARLLLGDSLVQAAGRGARVLVVEPVSRRVVPWWSDWELRFRPLGAEVREWRLQAELPERLRLMDRAAGLDHRVLTARSIWLPGDL